MSARNYLQNEPLLYTAVRRNRYGPRHMLRRLTPRALERAQWYSDLIIALGEAEKLLVILECDGGFPAETAKLRKRVETLRAEVTQLNRVILGEGRILPGDWPAAGDRAR